MQLFNTRGLIFRDPNERLKIRHFGISRNPDYSKASFGVLQRIIG